MERDVIIALDFATTEETIAFLDKFTEEKPFVKIGMEAFYGNGPELVREVKKRGHKIFLDLKLHDIPNTVKKAMKNLAKLDVDMVNLHAAGGSEMMKGALEGLKEGNPNKRPILLAVTQLTSTSQEMMNNEQGISGSVEDSVKRYALVAKEAGCDGVVCSPLEASMVRETCGEDFVSVTPGIRFADSKKDDQVRITTPFKAREIGSHYIVVGRPITQAENPMEAYRRCVREFVEGKED